MAETEKKPAAEKKKAAARKPAAKKAAPAPAAAPKPAAKPKAAAPAPKKVPEKAVRVTQIKSPAGRYAYQRATLKGLGLNKMNRTRVLEDTPAVRGMIETVRHLIRIDPV